MQIILYIASVLVIFITLLDVFITVFSMKGAGPLTGLWIHPWNGLLFIHKSRPIHRLLTFAGPFILISSIIIWYVLLGIGVFIAFAANPDSVINSSTGEQAGLTEKLYFVSNTISSLGYGDWVPSRFPWTLIATLATLAATVVLTISLSYVLSVVSAVVTKRKLAQGIFSMGKTVPEIIERARLSDPEETLKTHVLSLSSEMDHQSLKHLAYPILKYFHAGSADLSPARAVLLLSDTSFILGTAKKEHRPPPGVLQLMESSISNYLEFSRIRKKEVSRQTPYPQRLLEAERDYGIVSPDDVEFKQSLDNYLPLRNRLVALCREDGWNEEFT
ncbi:MAG: hypothetical protein WD038_10045 [Balneolales bacterium]